MTEILGVSGALLSVGSALGMILSYVKLRSVVGTHPALSDPELNELMKQKFGEVTMILKTEQSLIVDGHLTAEERSEMKELIKKQVSALQSVNCEV